MNQPRTNQIAKLILNELHTQAEREGYVADTIGQDSELPQERNPYERVILDGLFDLTAVANCILSNLIYAAAPEMLEALKELYRLRGLNCDLQDEASLRARAAIALATEDSK